MVLKSLSWLSILIIVLAVILFIFLLNFIIRVALLVLIVLAGIWLWNHIKKSKRRK
jgi:4-hydroxybenzoate polyprenyltransferase